MPVEVLRSSSIALVVLAQPQSTPDHAVPEPANIQRALQRMSVVASALVQRQQGLARFVPWRDSQTTRLLQRYLDGDAKLVLLPVLTTLQSETVANMFAHSLSCSLGALLISPSPHQTEEGFVDI